MRRSDGALERDSAGVPEIWAEVVDVSVHEVWCQRAFAEARHLHFPLLADFEPKGDVARAYGAYRSAEGVSERALFVIDKNVIIT